MDEAVIKKLRIQPNQKLLILQAPEEYVSDLSSYPEGVTIQTTPGGTYEFVMLFVRSIAELEEYGPVSISALEEGGQLWVCYPKKTSKIKTDINRDIGWDTFINRGYEGVSQIAIDDTFSALRFRPKSEIKQYTRKQTIGIKGNSYPKKGERAPVAEAVLPDDFKQALVGDKAASGIFENLAPSYKRAYIEWVTGAKREDTRARRIGQSIEKIKAGRKGPHA
ncbi:YdeI/OmpD-associated family protein [Fredinandcohnia humi]